MKGQAHLLNGAKAAFEQALGSRWLLWQILAALANVESDDGRSATLKS